MLIIVIIKEYQSTTVDSSLTSTTNPNGGIMVTQWTPKSINHSELKSKGDGIVGPFMVLTILFLALLFGAAIMAYAFAGVSFHGDLFQILQAWSIVAKRLGHLSGFFDLEHLGTFLRDAVVPSIVVFLALCVIYAYRKSLSDN